ncbi:MAG: long-chain fatty acid--CoA ligase [Acidobacteria bacterium]|nr:MAG: long-chain fatty acid--CoA ligase [Acidobacteriota bacterium]
MNIAEYLSQSAQRYPEKTALIFAEQRWSYRQLYEKSRILAARLRELGVRRGDRVAIYMPNSPEFVLSYYAVEGLGAVAVTLSALLKRREIAEEITDCGARLLITTRELVEHVPDATELPHLQHIITAGGAEGQHIPLESLLDGAERVEWISLSPDDEAAILYTSGTTGYPKGAVLTHGNVTSNVAATVRYTGMTSDDRLMCFLPLFHCFGQNFIMNACFAAGATLVLHPKFEFDEILHAVHHHEVTMFFAVPTIYKRLYDANVPREMLQSIRYYFTAAAKMPKELALDWKSRYGMPIYEGYGLTECSPFACYNHATQWVAGSVGTPIEGVDMKVVDLQTGESLGPHQLGEMCIKGPNVMKGYWNAPEATARVIDGEGWLHTGDVGYMDERGYFFIVDRVKDMINPGGFTVSPSEIEDILCLHPHIADACVVGVPHEDLGEAIMAYVVPRGAVTEQEVLDFCRREMAKHKVPHFVKFVPSIPVSPTGKKLRRLLKPGAPDRD